jgi:hypothetical protein
VERIVADVGLRSQLEEDLASRSYSAPVDFFVVGVHPFQIASIAVRAAQVSGEFMTNDPRRIRRIAVQCRECGLHHPFTCDIDLSFNLVVVVDDERA